MNVGTCLNVICYGYNPWSDMWKRNQTMVRMMTDLPFVSKTLFVNPDVFLSDLARRPAVEMSAFRRNYWRYVIPKDVRADIRVVTPLRLPLNERVFWLKRFGDILTLRAVRPYTSKPFLLLINRLVPLPNAIFESLFHTAQYRVFDWSDDFETFCSSENERANLARVREKYLRECDLVLTVNDSLTKRARDVADNVYTIRNATDFDSMNRADQPATPVAESIKRIPKPIIGYMGYLNSDRLDLELIEFIVRAKPQWQFVFIGPHSHKDPLGSEIPAMDNVHILPAVPYDRLPTYLKGFDVCVIPNRINEHTRGNDPIKLFDYLATGRPIVSTATAGTEQFRDVIAIAGSAEEFLALVEDALYNDDTEKKRARIERARENSWDARFRQPFRLIEERFADRRF